MAYRHVRHKLLGPFWYPHSNIKTTIIAWQSRGWRWCRHQNYVSTGIAVDLGLKRFAKTRHWALVQLSATCIDCSFTVIPRDVQISWGFGTSKHSLRAQEKQRLQQHNSGAFSARQRLQHDKASMFGPCPVYAGSGILDCLQVHQKVEAVWSLVTVILITMMI